MGLFRRIWALGNRHSLEYENEDELREHMQMRIDANLVKGMSPEQAAHAARLRFGNPAVVRERVDAEDAAFGLDSFFRDARHAYADSRRVPASPRSSSSLSRSALAPTPPSSSYSMPCG